jgi:hypothetical protein
MQEGLEQRGFTVSRLNTYNTVPVESLSPADLDAARSASVAAFASPSAVKSWLALVGDLNAVDVAIACIGADAKPDEHCIVFLKAAYCLNSSSSCSACKAIRFLAGNVIHGASWASCAELTLCRGISQAVQQHRQLRSWA